MFKQSRNAKSFIAAILISLFFGGCHSPQKKQIQTELHAVNSSSVRIPEPKILETRKELTKIQFGSCAHQKYPQPLWKTMLNENPDLYIGTGDNIYASSASDKPIAQAYKLQSLQPEFAIYRNQVPMIASWDDHDYGASDGGAENPEKEDAKLEFLKFWPNDAQEIDPRQGGIYHSFLLGPEKRKVQIILLDTRYFRDALVKSNNPPYPPGQYVANQNKETTILGSVQWQWLENELKKPAALRILVSSIQFLAKEHGFEKWDNFPHERERLLKLLTKYPKLIVISGDRHAGEISRLKQGRHVLYDITASGINRNSTLKDEKNRLRQGQRILDSNFGQININWKQKKFTMDLIDMNGKHITHAEKRF